MNFKYFGASAYLLIATVTAQTPSSNISIIDLAAQLPGCALNCIIPTLSSNPETLTNPAATCKNITLQASLSACIQGQCNFTEQAQVGNVNKQLCKSVSSENRFWKAGIVGLVCGPIALIAIALRMYSRHSSNTLALDDWIMVLVGAILCAIIALDIESGVVNGLGKHYWNIDPLEAVPSLKVFYVSEVFYVAIVTLVKAAILLFYLRIFPARWFRITNKIVLGLNMACGLAFLMAILFQCNPVYGAWNRSIPRKCLNVTALAYATGGIGIALDFIILVLPIPELIGLKMTVKKKVHILFMFSLGSLAMITSIVRLTYLVGFATSTDQSWDNVIPALWSLLEICIAIICACLPAMRALFSRFLPSIFNIDSSNRSTTLVGPNPIFSHDSHFSKDKIGPSYKKRSITPAEQDFLNHISSKNGRCNGKTTTRVWVNPTFEEHGNLYSKAEEHNEGQSQRYQSDDGSVFMPEGRSESDEMAILEQMSDIAMQDFGRSPASSTRRLGFIRVETTTTTHASTSPRLPRKI